MGKDGIMANFVKTDYNREYNRTHYTSVSLRLDTGGALPALDGREFTVDPPF